jgi:thiopeptide-type bacteriocin biosynthesis protein
VREVTPIANIFAPSGFFVLRTPLLPYDELRRWSSDLAAPSVLDRAKDDGDSTATELDDALARDRAALRAGLAALIERPEIREAIHVASPDLDAALGYWKSNPDGEEGRRVERSLVRYLSRMAARPTPFGLFAGTSVGIVASDTRLEIAPLGEYRRLTRLDMGYLAALIDVLSKDPQLAPTLPLRSNDTLYWSAGRWRYVEWRIDPRRAPNGTPPERTHHLVAVDDTPHLRSTLDHARASESGATTRQLAAALAGDGITLERAEEFINKLVESQVLVPDLPLHVTGGDPLAALAQIVRDHGATSVADRMDDVVSKLDAIDEAGVGVPVSRYDVVNEALDALQANVDRRQLLHVDMSKPAPRARLGASIVREISAGADLLRRLGRSGGETALDRFRTAFTRRYEAREVPLLEALDEEMGIGFTTRDESRGDAEPLLVGLDLVRRSDPTTYWGGREGTLLRLLLDALKNGNQEIALSKSDIEALSSDRAPSLPSAFAAMATIAAGSDDALRRGDYRVLITSAHGPSGAPLLGRFCHVDTALREHVEHHLRAEEALDADAVFAEVVHLANPRVGNILSRPVLREFEITYMGRSGAPVERQIPARDIMVSVHGDRVVLRSARLGRRVVPRLTSAHEYTWKSMGVYHFLCALQTQGVAATAWNWGPLNDAPFLPRVSAGRVVLSLARWRVPKNELEALGREKDAALMRTVRRWRAQRGLSRMVRLADADHTLTVDLDNILSVESFVQLIRRREVAVLEEVFPEQDKLCVHGPEGAFTHELIVPFIQSAAAPQSVPALPSPQADEVRRRFPPGSEWAYAKIYTGTPTADRILCTGIAPLVRRALESGWIDQWFFVRYADPEPHLRVRFHGDPKLIQAHLLPDLNNTLGEELTSGRSWRVQLDTYEREIERYAGSHGILLSERIFEIDSDAAVALAELFVRGRMRGADRWRLALVATDRLLDDLRLDAKQRRELLESMRDSYAEEHGAGTALTRQISERYRVERPRLAPMLEAAARVPPDDSATVSSGVRDALAILRGRSARLAAVVEELYALASADRLTMPIPRLASSLVHLSLVRHLRSAVRAQETVIYDFLCRVHAERLARGAKL